MPVGATTTPIPEAIAPKTRQRPRDRAKPPRRSLRNFELWIVLPAALAYVAACALVLFTLDLMTSSINRIDSDRATKAVNAVLATVTEQLGDLTRDQAGWTEAYLNTLEPLNAAWVDAAWGVAARAGRAYDAAMVTDENGVVLFGESLHGSLAGTLTSHTSGSADLLAAMRVAMVEQGKSAVVTGFTARGGGVAAIAAAAIHPTGTTSPSSSGGRILWLTKAIDSELLMTAAQRSQIPLPHFAASAPAGEQSVRINDASGNEIGMLVWRPLRPGDAAFLHTVGIAAVVLIALGVLGFAVLAAFRRSVARRVEVEERGWIDARFDEATGLLNRFGLEEALQRSVPLRTAGPLAVAIVEFEGLKDIAASYGDETVEKLLDRIAERIEPGAGAGTLIGRIGPDQLALARTDNDAGEAVRDAARAVLSVVSEAHNIDELRLKPGASIGFAEGSVTRDGLADVFSMAVTALQAARETGGAQFVAYDASLERERRRRLVLHADIRRGFEADEFDLDYQPIFGFDQPGISGVEALLRWRRRAGGPMSPSTFIPAAEASGQIEDLGLFALHRACREIAPYESLKLSVNVSTVQFRSANLAEQIDAVLRAAGFPPRRLQLEITESFLVVQPERAVAVIENLRARGIAIALDDFGTGFSSIGYLRQFRFDRLKLDRSLVVDIDTDPVHAALVESTMVLARALGLAVTAEGVERHEEARYLSRLGCREFQGYLFSKPLTLPALQRLIDDEQRLRVAS